MKYVFHKNGLCLRICSVPGAERWGEGRGASGHVTRRRGTMTYKGCPQLATVCMRDNELEIILKCCSSLEADISQFV
jgi:hypothetical protein